jgi:hypothetical protein
MRSKALVLIAVLMLAHLVAGSPSPAAAAQGATILSITHSGCFIDVAFQVEDAGDYFLNAWDDGNYRGGAGGPVPAGWVMTVRYVIGDPILQGAAGIGLYIEEALGPTASVLYDSNGSYNDVPQAVGDACAAANVTSVSVVSVVNPSPIAGCDVLVPLTADAAVGTFVADADAYWSPGSLTNPLITLAAGKTAWVLGLDASGQYYQILWSCEILWVKTNTIGPNYDDVWQGHPLPTSIVD